MNPYILKAFVPLIFIGGICLFLEAKIEIIHERELPKQKIIISPEEVFVNSPVNISISSTQKNLFWIIEENIYNDTNLTHTFHAPGDKIIYAIIGDKQLNSSNINVREPLRPLEVKIITLPSKDSIPVGDSVQFSAVCSKEARFKWVCNDSNQKTGDTVFYTFKDSGSYTIELTAESDEVLVGDNNKALVNIIVYKPKIVEKVKPIVTPKKVPIQKTFTISEGNVKSKLQDIVDDPSNFNLSMVQLKERANPNCGNITFNVKIKGATNVFSLDAYCNYLRENPGSIQIISVTDKGNCSCTVIQQ